MHSTSIATGMETSPEQVADQYGGHTGDNDSYYTWKDLEKERGEQWSTTVAVSYIYCAATDEIWGKLHVS